MASAKHALLSTLILSSVSLSLLIGTSRYDGVASAASALTSDKINGDRDINAANLGAGSGRTTPYKAAPAGYDATMVRKWVAAHQAAKGQGYKYVFVPPELASSSETANEMRVAAGKAWNHLSWISDIDVPEDISDGSGLAFALNAAKVWGADADKNWGFVAACTPKRNIRVSPAPRGDCAQFAATDPVAIPRFVYNATNGGPYANVHKTPTDFDAFTQKFTPGPLKYVSTHKEAIVCGPRMTAYRMVNFKGQQLLYSFTSDEFDGRDQGSIRYSKAPTDQDQRQTGSFDASPGGDDGTAIASEWWIQLPNGFLYYSIHGEGAQERGKAEVPFAIDPANWKQDATLATGRSCITCHANGTQSAVSDKEFAGKNGWTSNDDLSKLYAGSRDKFQRAMRTLVDGLSDADPALNERMVNGTVEVISKAIVQIEGKYPGNSNYTCESFCRGKFGPSRRKLCESMPAQ